METAGASYSYAAGQFDMRPDLLGQKPLRAVFVFSPGNYGKPDAVSEHISVHLCPNNAVLGALAALREARF
jgi:hypothetical protein